MQVERVDFVTIPTRDPNRARAFYHEMLGLPLDSNNPAEVTAAQVTLAFWNPESEGLTFSPNQGGVALRVADVAAARLELESKGIVFEGTRDSGVCHMAFFQDPDGNWIILHRRYAPYE
ncbi:MAG: VOC family protein [Actinobacteria bacterium]|nr:MAG: VOC family protein [Actinomycetota bacterium]